MELVQHLDTITQLVTFSAIALGLGLSVGIYWWRQRTVPGLSHFMAGIFLVGLGVAGLASRGFAPLWFSVIFGNFLVGGALVALLGSVRLFNGRRARLAMPVASLLLMTVILGYDVLTRDDIVLRSIVATIWIVGIKLLITYECWRYGRQVAPRLWVAIATIFGGTAVVLSVRLADLLLHPDAEGIFAPSPIASLNFLLTTLGLVMGCIAMMAVTNEWLQRRLEMEAAENARIAQERDQAAQTAEAANHAKSMFLAAVSHEIRTPVNAVLGGLEILHRQDPPPTGSPQHKVLEVMEKAGQSMMALLDDLLDITRMEAGHLSLVPQPTDLHQRLHDAIDLMAGRAAASGLLLDIVIAPDVPRHVSIDQARLRQILLNLIGNAIKFTEHGGIRVEVSRQQPSIGDASMTPGAALIRISVADTGIGIAPDKLPHVFDAFYQVEAGNSRRFGGVGLGLAICKRLVDMMGGAIRAESAQGYGTVFTLDLPMPLTAPPAQASQGSRLLPYWTSRPAVLLVEDDAVNQFVATQLLTRQGFQVTAAEDGETALRLLETLRVRLVLMDIGMPGLDGFETTARLRAGGGPMATVPVIALTANVLPETVSRSRMVGMQGFLTKPIKLDELLAALARHIPPDGIGSIPEASRASEAASAPRPPADAGPVALLRGRLGTPAIDGLLSLAAQSVADARQQFRLTEGRQPPPLADLRRVALRLADGLDCVGFTADAQALRDCLGLLRPGQPMNTALAAMDAILADTQARLPRTRRAAAE